MLGGILVEDILQATILPPDASRTIQQAGHVYQQVRRCAAQDPPPPSRTRRSRKSEGENKQTRDKESSSGAGKGDENDSDGDDNPPKQQGPGVEPHGTTTKHGGRLLGAKRQLESRGVLSQREQRVKEQPARIRALLGSLETRRLRKPKDSTKSRYAYRWCLVNIKEPQGAFQGYLDKVVYDDFDESLEVQGLPRQTCPFDPSPVLKEVELGLVKRCAIFDRCRTEQDLRNIGRRITAIIRRLSDYVLGLGRAADIGDVKLRLCPEDPNTPPEIAKLVDGYLNSILTAVLKETNQEDPATLGKRVHNGGLCLQYRAGLLKWLSLTDLERAQWQWEIRKHKSSRLREIHHLTALGELFEGIERPGSITLVLFSGGRVDYDNLLAIKEVSPADLHRMGWHHDMKTAGRPARYWRYESHGATTDDGVFRQGIFKVGMDGEIFAVLDLDDMACLRYGVDDDQEESEDSPLAEDFTRLET